ncbi:TetR/AcrR family transcriptional regulator [Paenibacillus sp. NFR01]|uniref:TetR/AcrR family transcriptional regulator n=1 Tax=Paenibacillus sp. NFR01 TaxID=1566279 RepID=UPI0008D76A69|nr:TetR/AcrR family transcriptional regulator [Paenibacillus sp. NFR01]SET86989.1 transcriptional regulator, TetR family [Paenibacillus sp. NFR01]
MEDKLDRRQLRTKQLLYDALMGLIEEKGADHVTVTDITKRANVNRGTFYLHYRDVPDMVEQLENEVFERIRGFAARLDFQDSIRYIEQDQTYPIIEEVFEELARHAGFLRIMLGPKGDFSFARKLRELLSSHLYDKVSLAVPNPVLPRDYVVAYMISANFGLIMHWLESGMDQTPAQLAQIMTRIAYFGPMVSFGIKARPGESPAKP